jgi:DNA-binding response OmpR family regulator
VNILIVDDDQDIAKTYYYVLRDTGHRAMMALSAEECMKIYNESLQKAPTTDVDQYHLILLDYKLPDRNGFELAREIVTISPHQKIVFVTAYADTLNRHMEKFKMSMDILEKPVSNEVLLNAIREFDGIN